jgi:hypothetical protein
MPCLGTLPGNTVIIACAYKRNCKTDGQLTIYVAHSFEPLASLRSRSVALRR